MLTNINKELNRFAKYVISQSRANLTRGKKGGGRLYKSLDSSVKVSKNSFELSFLMEDYGIFQDKGVKGTKSKRRNNRLHLLVYKSKRKTGLQGCLSIDKWM